MSETNANQDLLKTERLPRWEMRPMDFALFPCLALTSILAISMASVQGYKLISGQEIDQDSMAFGIVAGIGTQIGLLIAFFAFLHITQISKPDDRSSSLGFALKVGFTGLIVAYLAMIPLNYFWELLINSLNLPDELQTPVTMLQEGGSRIEVILMGFLIIVIAPVCEEIAYRGVIFRFLVGRAPIWVAVTLSAAIFSAMHYNLYSSFPLFILGCGLAIVYHKSGNILSSIFMHSLFNGVSFIVIITTKLSTP